MKIRMNIEVEVDDEIYGTSSEDIEWLMDQVLNPDNSEGKMILHSNMVGDEIGIVTKVGNISIDYQIKDYDLPPEWEPDWNAPDEAERRHRQAEAKKLK